MTSRAYATSVAARVGATHHLHRVTERDYVDQLQRTVVQLDEPMNHAHTVHLQLLSRFAKSYVTVALTGEGADELFGGYPRLHIPLLAKRLAWLPTVVADGVRSVAHTAGYRRVVKLLESGGSERDGVVHGARFVPRHDFDRLYPAAPLTAPHGNRSTTSCRRPVSRVWRASSPSTSRPICRRCSRASTAQAWPRPSNAGCRFSTTR